MFDETRQGPSNRWRKRRTVLLRVGVGVVAVAVLIVTLAVLGGWSSTVASIGPTETSTLPAHTAPAHPSAEAKECAYFIQTMVVTDMEYVPPGYVEQILGNLGADSTTQRLVVNGMRSYQQGSQSLLNSNALSACQTNIDNGTLDIDNLEWACSQWQQVTTSPAPACTVEVCPGSDD